MRTPRQYLILRIENFAPRRSSILRPIFVKAAPLILLDGIGSLATGLFLLLEGFTSFGAPVWDGPKMLAQSLLDVLPPTGLTAMQLWGCLFVAICFPQLWSAFYCTDGWSMKVSASVASVAWAAFAASAAVAGVGAHASMLACVTFALLSGLNLVLAGGLHSTVQEEALNARS